MKPLDDYAQLHADFHWHVPAQFNIADDCCRRWACDSATAQRTAIITDDGAGNVTHTSFAQLQAQADAISHALVACGVQRGDRVAIVMPQCVATAAAHMAIYQMGAVAMPLSILFGPDALEYRLQDSAAVAALVDASVAQVLRDVQPQCPALASLWVVDADNFFTPALPKQTQNQNQGAFKPIKTAADDAAVLIYTSGTTGPAKGALIPHRALLGNLTGFVASQNWFGFTEDEMLATNSMQPASSLKKHSVLDPLSKAGEGRGGVAVHSGKAQSAGGKDMQSVFWSPADWAWTGGLMDALLPSLYFGKPIVACRARFSADLAFELMQRHAVTHTFLFPTALKAMMKAYPTPPFTLALQAIMSAGEAVGETVFAWSQAALGVRINEMFGQTEVNYIVGNSDRWPARAGSMGRGYPGHQVAVIDDEGKVCAPNVAGDVAVNRYDRHGHLDPVFFLGYWKREAATVAKYTGDWCRTGDLATQDADGYLWYQGRADDMFKAAGYRIGPSEVENCLVQHAAVANAAVVPKPDRERGAVVKAFVVLVAGVQGSDALVAELQAHVRGKLAPYEYPKEIEFIEALPMTTTGKVQRKVLRDLELTRAAQLAEQ
jgi:acetyl-CoA synthetase